MKNSWELLAIFLIYLLIYLFIITIFTVDLQTQLIANKNQLTKDYKNMNNIKKRSCTKSDTPLVNIQDALHVWHSYRSHSNQSVGYNNESSDWCLDDPNEQKEKQDLRGNWLKVCYLLHIIQPHSIISIFLVIFLN